MKPKTDMTTPNPSKAQEWWQEKPFCEEGSSDWEQYVPEYDIPAIIRESERLKMEEVKKAFNEIMPCVQTNCDNNGVLMEGFSDDPEIAPCQYCHEHRLPFLDRLASLSNGDVEGK